MTDLAQMLRDRAAAHGGHKLLEEAAAALEAAREDAEDAARYRWLCDGNGYFMEEAGLCHINNEKPEADAAIDKAMRGEW